LSLSIPQVSAELPKRARRWDIAALLIFLLASAIFNRSLIGEDLTRVVPVAPSVEKVAKAGGYPETYFAATDLRFVVWLLSRNARTLVTHPTEIFQAEQCHPVVDGLALGESAISQGVIGIPGYLLSRDPIATYNFIWILLPLLSASVMYWVVKSWTASPPAAIAAGVLFAFHPLKVHDPVHFYIYDTTWMVLGLFFAQRLFAHRRWRDAVGLLMAISMQLAGSLYPTVAAVLAGVSFLVWLVRQYGLRGQNAAQWLVVSIGVFASATVLFGPYLSLVGEGSLATRPMQVFRPLSFLLPSQEGFPGIFTLGLGVAAFALPLGRGLPGLGRDVRFVLLLAIGLIYGISIGALDGDFMVLASRDAASGGPANFYMWLAQWLPGIGLVRAPALIFNCAVPLIVILVGIGAAALLRSCPTALVTPAALLLIGLSLIDVFRPPLLGLTPHFVFTTYEIRPNQEWLDFYAALAAKGNRGPLLLLPATPRSVLRESAATLLSAYHQRRIGQCYNSFHAPEVNRVREISKQVPDPGAIRELAKMGFTTLVANLSLLEAVSPGIGREFERAMQGPEPLLREIHARGLLRAYEILVRPPSP
jgi:hypothetical protein